jgi:hypothetical protein
MAVVKVVRKDVRKRVTPPPKKKAVAKPQPDLSREAVAARSKAAGKHPTKAAIEKTYQRNLLRRNGGLAYSGIATKAEVQKELAAIAARGKKRYGKSLTQAQVLSTYRANKVRVQGRMNKELAAIAGRSKAKGKNPTAAAVLKTYYNNAQRKYAGVAPAKSGARPDWEAFLHPRGYGGKFSYKGGSRRTAGRTTKAHHLLTRLGGGRPVRHATAPSAGRIRTLSPGWNPSGWSKIAGITGPPARHA